MTRIAPATREIRGPAGMVAVPPRVMQVFLALADAKGAVVTRDDLIRQCWGGRFVADDSINGAIAQLRKALRGVGVVGVGVETVPKTGYRLAGLSFVEQPPGNDGAAEDRSGWRPSRRLAVAGGAVAVVAGGTIGWRAFRADDREATALIDRAAQAMRQGLPDPNAQGVQFLQQAVKIAPDNAKAWGMLALAWRAAAEYAGPDLAATARSNAETSARRALALDPRQSDALTALAILTPAFGQWVDVERRLRGVLAIDPANTHAVAALSTLLMSTGQVRASLRQLDWLLEREPLSPNLHFRRVYTLWSAGRLAEMDRAADLAIQSWPRHPAVWFARLWTLAFTDRAAAALAMLADAPARPPMPPPAARVLQSSLEALQSKAPADVAAATAANLSAAARGPGQAVTAIMVLSSIGASDRALDVARGYLTRQGPVVIRLRHTSAQPSVTDQHHRIAMMLWIPTTENLRRHPGFMTLCEDIGLVDYWKRTATRPDFQRAGPGAV